MTGMPASQQFVVCACVRLKSFKYKDKDGKREGQAALEMTKGVLGGLCGISLRLSVPRFSSVERGKGAVGREELARRMPKIARVEPLCPKVS